MQYVWLTWSVLFLTIWFIIYITKESIRKEMLVVSLWTMLFGLTEPLFVPEYWSPLSLFNLAQKTGFDFESLIFSFAIGGIASVLYNLTVRVKLIPFSNVEKVQKKHSFHRYTLIVPIIVFLLMAILTDLNHIYCGITAMFAGAIAALWCRPDLKKKIWIGAGLFTVLYILYFSSLTIAFPLYVTSIWNMQSISGILLIGIPIEEYLFAFTFGMLWSSIYEHIRWYKVISIHKKLVTHENSYD